MQSEDHGGVFGGNRASEAQVTAFHIGITDYLD
jgi:hypothetical protein